MTTDVITGLPAMVAQLVAVAITELGPRSRGPAVRTAIC
jgi:hypothetical protein